MNYAIELLDKQLSGLRSLSNTYEHIIYHPNHGLDNEQILVLKRELMVSDKRIEDIEIAMEVMTCLRHGEKKLKKQSHGKH